MTDGRIICFATQGVDSLDHQRVETLLEPLESKAFPFDRGRRARSALQLLLQIARDRPELVVMEGTGVAGGVGVILGSMLLRVPYVVSSGDAVGPYLSTLSRGAGVAGAIYERLLYRRSAGVIGWTPYLSGRAISLGADHAMTAAGWARGTATPGARERIRDRLRISQSAVVFGIVGSLAWSERRRYAYGMELVSAVRRTSREDVVVCVIGDGSGRGRLEKAAGDDLGSRVLLPGRISPDEVPDYLEVFDVASLPQSVDQVGAFRYSTKLSEYLSAGVPVVTGQIPAAYDLDSGWLWRLPGSAPWDARYITAMAALMERVTRQEISSHRANVPMTLKEFDLRSQQDRVSAFLTDIAQIYAPKRAQRRLRRSRRSRRR